LPWSHISFFTSWAGRSGVAVRHAPLGVAQRPRRRVSDDTGAPSPAAKRKREPTPFAASPKNLLATPVSTAVTLTHSHPHPRHAHRVHAGRRRQSTPRRTSARTRTCIAAGSAGQSPANGHPMAVPGGTAVHRLSRLFSRDPRTSSWQHASVELIVLSSLSAEGVGIRGTARCLR